MYVLFWSPVNKACLLRLIRSEESYDLPDTYLDAATIDDGIEGFLDSLAAIAAKARDEGWRNYTISVEDVR